jgi:molybdopterin molybdotransferase
MRLVRKIVSDVGTTDVCPVRWAGDEGVEPMASFAEAGLVAAAQADGFVIVPEASEGYAQGATVSVYVYPERGPLHTAAIRHEARGRGV